VRNCSGASASAATGSRQDFCRKGTSCVPAVSNNAPEVTLASPCHHPACGPRQGDVNAVSATIHFHRTPLRSATFCHEPAAGDSGSEHPLRCRSCSCRHLWLLGEPALRTDISSARLARWCRRRRRETKEQIGALLVLEAGDLDHAVQLISPHPGLKFGPWEVRPAGDLNAMVEESKRRPGMDEATRWSIAAGRGSGQRTDINFGVGARPWAGDELS